MEENYCVYVHEFPNGKVYVGQGKQPIENRWKNGWGYCGQKRMYNAIKKYGWENVKHKIVYINLSRKSAYEKEIELIKGLNSNATRGNLGYNMSDGGESGSFGYKHTEATREKLRVSSTGKTISKESRQLISLSKEGKPRSEETKRKISEASKGRVMSKEERIMRSESVSEITRQKLREANTGSKHPQFGLLGSNNPHSRPVLCVETGIVYGCLTDAGKEFNSDVSHISSACRGKRKTANGYHWEYANKLNV